jgi:hypothetical protein
LKEKLQHFWRTWQKVAKRIGDFQAWLILSLCYVVMVLPIGLFAGFFSDPLRIKRASPFWLNKTSSPARIDEARRQF